MAKVVLRVRIIGDRTRAFALLLPLLLIAMVVVVVAVLCTPSSSRSRHRIKNWPPHSHRFVLSRPFDSSGSSSSYPPTFNASSNAVLRLDEPLSSARSNETLGRRRSLRDHFREKIIFLFQSFKVYATDTYLYVDTLIVIFYIYILPENAMF